MHVFVDRVDDGLAMNIAACTCTYGPNIAQTWPNHRGAWPRIGTLAQNWDPGPNIAQINLHGPTMAPKCSTRGQRGHACMTLSCSPAVMPNSASALRMSSGLSASAILNVTLHQLRLAMLSDQTGQC